MIYFGKNKIKLHWHSVFGPFAKSIELFSKPIGQAMQL
jgi:hypothetical protein